MGKISINFAEVTGGFEKLPEGPHPVIVEKVEVRESKSSENNYLNWELKVSEGEHEGSRLWMITSLSPKALFRLKDVFEALGVLDDEMELDWDDDIEITPGAGPTLLEPDVIGIECTAVVKNETYEGKERNRVDEIRAAGATSGGGTKKASSGAKAGTRRALR